MKRQLTEEIKKACEIKDKVGKPFKIVCINSYEFEGKKFIEGDISYNSWGRNIPDNWRKATSKDLENYLINS